MNHNTNRAAVPAVVGAIGAALATGNAFAGELATAVTGALDPAELTLIGVGVLALVGLVVLIKMGRKTAGA